MFKKPLGNLKTSAPLRGSDRRKLKQRVVAAFGISNEDGDQLVPDGILSIKFNTHLNEQGVAYLAPDGDPLWFTIGKGSEELIPTVYTLWKKRDLLPFISTPSSVIPVLVGGADLMIPGVIHHSPSIAQGQTVSVCQFSRVDGNVALSAPLAVGRMAVPSDQMRDGDKGKAVLVVHTWKDHLWDMGSKADVPEPIAIQTPQNAGEALEEGEVKREGQAETEDNDSPASPTTDTPASISYTPQEITALLHTSLLQAISTTLASLPSSPFPIPSTQFYTNYVLPSRPAYPALVLPPSLAPQEMTNEEMASLNPQAITIKTSSYKSLTTFLKAAEKSSLLTLKTPQKHSQQTDLLVISVNANHPTVIGHGKYVTVKKIEDEAAKRALREESKAGAGNLVVKELWKPHLDSIALFEAMGGKSKTLYNMHEIKALLNSYISEHNLTNPRDQAYVNLDQVLMDCVYARIQTKSKNKNTEEESSSLKEFMKREELSKKIIKKMQDWYEVHREGENVVQKKGSLKPIQVTMKVRQGRKASTLVTGFEQFLVIDAESMAEDLRKACAGATSVSPVSGKSGKEVLVQGKQSKAVVEYLTEKGVPKQWIEVVDHAAKR
ncbi:hypothetical protein AX17_003011 [Amanita inopinata Kibby_2008]|nr:hypothetical protein AX17_003011 [Amanita inopinata Kibby_2008]